MNLERFGRICWEYRVPVANCVLGSVFTFSIITPINGHNNLPPLTSGYALVIKEADASKGELEPDPASTTRVTSITDLIRPAMTTGVGSTTTLLS